MVSRLKAKYQSKIHIRKYKDYNKHYENLNHTESEYRGKEEKGQNNGNEHSSTANRILNDPKGELYKLADN